MHDARATWKPDTTRVIAAALALLLLIGGRASSQAPCRYEVEYIPNPPPCQFWERYVGVTGISPNGRYVCGAIGDCNLGNFAVVVDTQPPGGGGAMQMTVIPRPQGVTTMDATGVNDKMEVCGTMKLSPNLSRRGFLWRNGQLTDLGVPQGAWDVEADAINNKTEITGLWCCSPGNRAYLWRDGVFTTLELPLSSAIGSDIDDESRVVGRMNPFGSGPNEAFLWSKSGAISLGTLPEGTAWARSIASNGDVAGIGGIPHPDNPSGFTARAFLYRKGEMIDLGLLPGAIWSQAYSTNGISTIGTCGFENDSAAFVFTNGIMRRLDQLQPDKNLVIGHSTAISLDGSVAARGRIGGTHHGIVLRQVNAPIGDITLDCKVNVMDLLAIINSWGPCGSKPFCPTDANGDGTVNQLDILVLVQQWGQQA